MGEVAYALLFKMFLDHKQENSVVVFLRFKVSGAWFKNLAQLVKHEELKIN